MMAVASALKQRYDTALRDELRKQFDFKNVMQIPRLDKIVVNIGMGEAIGNAKAMDAAAVGPRADHRPASGGHEVTARHLELQAAHRHADRTQGHAAR